MKARERVKAWKKDNYILLKLQRERRWQRTLATRVHTPTRVRSGVHEGTERREVREVQETTYVSNDEVEGDALVMAQHREALNVRMGRKPPPPIHPRVMEPAQEGGHTDVIPDMPNCAVGLTPETSQSLLEIEMSEEEHPLGPIRPARFA